MKFQTENKKPTLCIYTDEDYSAEKLEWEVRSLRQELDGTRAALRLQAARCRHLVAAFSTQINRSELAARRERELRDEQLSRLLRALLVLDAGLRREQRNIRDQLRNKDSVIHAQRLEIAILKGDKDLTRGEAEDISRTYRLQEDMFGEITRVHPSLETTQNGDMNDESNKSNSQLKTFKSHPYVKLTKKANNPKALTNNKIVKTLSSFEDEHPVHRQEGLEELQRMAKGLKKEIVEMNHDESYIDQEEEEMNRNLYEDYQHNPVLECVNQILLRDFEDDDDDKENYQRRPAVSRGREITETHLNGDDSKKKIHPKDKAASPPIKAQHLEEKACLLMTSQRLTLVRHADLDDVDNDKMAGKNDAPKRDSPPALPPKPKQLQLGSRGKQTLTTQQKQNGHEFITPHQEKPPQRKILSNGSLKYPLNHEHNSKQDAKNCSKTFEEKIEDMNITLLHHDTPRGMAVMNRTDNNEENSKNRKTKAVAPAPDKPEENSKNRKAKAVAPSPDKAEETMNNGKIKVASSISFLITGASRESIVSELSNGELPNVSNMVRRFEDLGTMKEVEEEEEEEKGNATLRENFEEFKLEDVDMGDDVSVEERPEGDGQETKNAPVSYETFLEATGLSQKSIMTPSRMYNNHRNVVRPKDVKQRSKLLKATSITNQGGNIVKYWTEPFL